MHGSELLTRVFHRLFRRPRFASKTRHADFEDHHSSLSPSLESRRIYHTITPSHSYHGEVFTDWQRHGKDCLSELLGLDKFNIDAPVVHCRLIWESVDDLGTYEKYVLTDANGVHIPVYRAVPYLNPHPRRWLVCLQGHTSGMHVTLGIDQTEEFRLRGPHASRDFGTAALRKGFGIVCLEQASLGTRIERKIPKVAPHPCFDASMHSILLGTTLMARRVHDISKTVEFFKGQLAGSSSWGVMGNSLGGSTSLYAAIFCKEIDYCAASCCVADFGESLLNLYHCADLYVPDLAAHFLMSDIIGLLAPKPTILCAGIADPIFPVTGFRKTILEAEEIFSASSKPKNLKKVIGMGGHRLYTDEILAELIRLD